MWCGNEEKKLFGGFLIQVHLALLAGNIKKWLFKSLFFEFQAPDYSASHYWVKYLVNKGISAQNVLIF